jgi:glycosyltransferase involved in cell wall biosynthesis
LADAGLRVTYVCGVGEISAALHHPLIDVRHLGFKNVWRPTRLGLAAVQAVWNEPARRALVAILAENNQAETIVHIHQWTKCLSPSIFAALGSVHWAVSLHDYFFLCPTGLFFISPRQTPCQLRPMSLPCIASNCDTRSPAHKAIRVVRQIATIMAVASAQKPINLIHVSAFAGDVARRRAGPHMRHFVVPNPGSNARGMQTNVKTNRAFVYIGRFQQEKGVLDFAKAARRVNVAALFLGDGPEAERIRELHPEAEVRPWGGAGAVQCALGEARCLVLPSRWYETFGLTVLEAQARGVPAIVARNSGAAEIIDNSGGGVVLENITVASLAETVGRLASDDMAVEQLGRQAYDHFSADHWSPAAFSTRLIECYRAILQSQVAC